MKFENGLVLNTDNNDVKKSKSNRSKIWDFLKLLMISIVISIVLTLLLIFCKYFI